MKFKKQLSLFCLIAVVEIPLNDLFSQKSSDKPTRQILMEAFSKGNYEKAYTEFRELLAYLSKGSFV